jgi:hypothetical protein
MASYDVVRNICQALITGLTLGRPYSFRVVTREAAGDDDAANKVGPGRNCSKHPSTHVIPSFLLRRSAGGSSGDGARRGLVTNV